MLSYVVKLIGCYFICLWQNMASWKRPYCGWKTILARRRWKLPHMKHISSYWNLYVHLIIPSYCIVNLKSTICSLYFCRTANKIFSSNDGNKTVTLCLAGTGMDWRHRHFVSPTAGGGVRNDYHFKTVFYHKPKCVMFGKFLSYI